MSARPAFLALPRLSLTTVLLNLPNIFDQANGATPLILMDRYDYDRLRAEVLAGPKENQKAPYLIMAYDDLRRRGLLKLIDYTEFYTPSDQNKYLHQSQALLRNTSEETNRETAVEASKSWIKYTRGEYQEPFRAGLGESASSFSDLRSSERIQRQKLKREVSDPRDWNEKLLSRGIAALAVRDQVNENLNITVHGIISGTQYQIIGDFIDGYSVDTTTSDTADLTDLQPAHRFLGIDLKTATQTREILDVISSVTSEIAGVQYNDWFLLGPSIAVPRYDDLFDIQVINDQMQKFDEETIAAETKQVIDVLENSTEYEETTNNLQYDAERVGEEYDLLPSGKKQNMRLNYAFDFAYNVANYSRELRYLKDQTDITQAAALVGSSIMRSNQCVYDDNDIYRHGLELMARFNPPPIDEKDIKAVRKERRGDSWDEHSDWFEAIDRESRYA